MASTASSKPTAGPHQAPAARLQRVLRLVVVLPLSAAVLLAGLAGAWGAFTIVGRPVWGWMGFELLLVVAGVIGVLTAFGRFRSGPGMALLCVAGTVGVAAFFGSLDAEPNLRAARPDLARFVDPALYARLAAAGLIAAAAAGIVLLRSAKSFRPMIVAICNAVPLLIAGAVYLLAWGRIAPALAALPEPVRVILYLLVGLALAIFAACTVHFAVRAFETAGEPRGEPDDNSASESKPASAGA
ncbi:MAG: hypothetical protein AAF995_07455 [Planctomycetota bacterium]